MATPEVSPEQIKSAAHNLGVPLSDEDAAKVAHGAARNRQLGEIVRGYVSPEIEPAATFSAQVMDS